MKTPLMSEQDGRGRRVCEPRADSPCAEGRAVHRPATFVDEYGDTGIVQDVLDVSGNVLQD